MLSIADCLLAVLWTVGGSLWLYNGVTTSLDAERVGCFTVLLMTVVSQLVLCRYNMKHVECKTLGA